MRAFAPEGGVKLPTVLVLHGARGLDSGQGYVQRIAEAWAAEGFAVLVVHYFESTGTTYAGDSTIYREFARWVEAVGEALSCAAGLAMVDAERMALAGYSLGGYLSVARAAGDERVRAVVEIAGGIDPEFAKGVARLPPMLLVHGEEDRRVPFDRALALRALLERLETPHETRFYPGEGHLLSPAVALDALSAGVEFLRRQLEPAR